MKIDIYLIMAGEATRWQNYRGVPKHFAPVHDFGPTVIHTIELVKKYAPEATLYGVVKDVQVEPYAGLSKYGVNLLEADLHPENGDADKILSSSKYWVKKNVTVIIWADTWLTDTCIQTIIAQAKDKKPEGWHFVSRFDGSPWTGSPGGENFASIIYPGGYTRYLKACQRIVKLYKDGTIDRNGGWELYKALHGLPDDRILVRWADGSSYDNPNLGNLTEVIDGSEDFDTPKDWDEWHIRWHQADEETRRIMERGHNG